MKSRVFNADCLRNVFNNKKRPFPYFNGMYFVIVPLMIILLSSFFVPPADWKLEKDSNGIKIYTRDIPGSSIKELKIQLTVKSTLAGVSKLFNDVTSFSQWVYNCKESKVIKSVNPFEYYSYCVYKVPWPADNRDEITHCVQTQDPVTKVITIKRVGERNFAPENDGIVRVQSVNCTTVLTPLNSGDVQIDYRVHMEPGGLVPAFLVNMFIANAPFNSFTNFKNIISRPENYTYRSEEITEP
jgi:hypothetical protein